MKTLFSPALYLASQSWEIRRKCTHTEHCTGWPVFALYLLAFWTTIFIYLYSTNFKLLLCTRQVKFIYSKEIDVSYNTVSCPQTLETLNTIVSLFYGEGWIERIKFKLFSLKQKGNFKILRNILFDENVDQLLQIFGTRNQKPEVKLCKFTLKYQSYY